MTDATKQPNPNSIKSQKHKNKKGAKRYLFELYATDADELVLIEKLKQAKANKQSIKDLVKTSLTEYFAKDTK